jgi:hypothetical protein
MGNSYGNVTLAGVDATRVAEVLGLREDRAFVLAEGDRVAVFSAAADENPALIAVELSARFDVPALAAFVFDSDLLVTWLAVGGQVVDRYVSNADLIDDGEDEPAVPLQSGVGFVGPLGVQLGFAQPLDEVTPALEAAGFQPDERIAGSSRFKAYVDEPTDPHALARDLSRTLGGLVELVLSGTGELVLYESGEQTFARPAEAEPSEPVPEGGDAEALSAAFGGDPVAIERLLRGAFPAESLHETLALALGLPAATVGVGFAHLEEGIELDPADHERLIRVL